MAQFNRNSWHYHLISSYTTYTDDDVDNICPYIRAVLIGILAVLAIITMVGGVVAAQICAILYCYVWLTIGLVGDPGFFGSIGIGIDCFAGLIGVVVWCGYKLELRKQRRREAGLTVDDTLLGAWLNKLHDKTCVPVDFRGAPTHVNWDAKVVGASIAGLVIAVIIGVIVFV